MRLKANTIVRSRTDHTLWMVWTTGTVRQKDWVILSRVHAGTGEYMGEIRQVTVKTLGDRRRYVKLTVPPWEAQGARARELMFGGALDVDDIAGWGPEKFPAGYFGREPVQVDQAQGAMGPAYHSIANPGFPDGSVTFRLLWKTFTLYGGPYRYRPRTYRGVCVASEVTLPCTVRLNIKDFQVPQVAELEIALMDTFRLLLAGHTVYVGCAGGTGRTGLFMAAFGKMLWCRSPVLEVRRQYKAHAVETKQQKQFLAGLNLWRLRWKCLGAVVKSLCN